VQDLRDGEIRVSRKGTRRERLGTLDERSARKEDYVEIIHQLVQMKGYARGVEIAEKLRVKQPTVTSMLQRLAEKGLVVYEKHRGVSLTSKGRSLARTMRHAHAVLAEFLQALGVDNELANKIAEDMEHCLPSEVLGRFESLTICLKEEPSLIASLKLRIEGARLT